MQVFSGLKFKEYIRGVSLSNQLKLGFPTSLHLNLEHFINLRLIGNFEKADSRVLSTFAPDLSSNKEHSEEAITEATFNLCGHSSSNNHYVFSLH